MTSEHGASQVQYTHTGQRYVLGYGPDFYGIWDRQSPDAPVERFPRTDDGWRAAWQLFSSREPGNAPVAAPAAYAPATPVAYGPAVAVPVAPTNGRAVASLVVGIIGILLVWIPLFGLILPILALVFGFMGKAAVDRSPGVQAGRGLAIAGIVLGWIGVAIGGLILFSVAADLASNI